jgi:hypothetical protein
MLEGIPSLIFWSDTKQFESLNNADDQITSGQFSDNLYDYLYDSALLSRSPTNLFIVFKDTLEGRDNIAHIQRDSTLADFHHFVYETGNKCLHFIDIPFDPTPNYVFFFLVFLSLWTRNLLFLIPAACLQIVPKLPRTESLLMVAYRYEMANLALDSLKVNHALGTVGQG